MYKETYFSRFKPNFKYRTPWGEAQNYHVIVNTEDTDEEFIYVACAGHGGIFISKALQKKYLPAAYRKSSGWYEEDCEACVQTYLPKELITVHVDAAHRGNVPKQFKDRDEHVKWVYEVTKNSLDTWYPLPQGMRPEKKENSNPKLTTGDIVQFITGIYEVGKATDQTFVVTCVGNTTTSKPRFTPYNAQLGRPEGLLYNLSRYTKCSYKVIGKYNEQGQSLIYDMATV